MFAFDRTKSVNCVTITKAPPGTVLMDFAVGKSWIYKASQASQPSQFTIATNS